MTCLHTYSQFVYQPGAGKSQRAQKHISESAQTLVPGRLLGGVRLGAQGLGSRRAGGRNKVPQAPGPCHQRVPGCRAVQRAEVGQRERTHQESNLGSEILAIGRDRVSQSNNFQTPYCDSEEHLGVPELAVPPHPLYPGVSLDSPSMTDEVCPASVPLTRASSLVCLTARLVSVPGQLHTQARPRAGPSCDNWA